MRRRFKTKKRINLNFIIYFIIFIFLIFILSVYISKFKFLNSNDKFITNIISDMSNQTINNIITYIDKNIFNSPINLLKLEFVFDKEKKESVYFAYAKVDKPAIYIYNSHQGEAYSMKYLEEYNITPNVLMASRMLSEKLNKLNINTIVEENNIILLNFI